MPSWDATLPDVSENYGQEVSPGVLELPMTSGRVRHRRLFTQETRGIPVEWCMSEAQWNTFQNWFRNTINLGQDYFDIDLPMGNGLEEVSARFVEGTLNVQHNSGKWYVTARLEVEGPPLMDEASYIFFTETEQDLELLEEAVAGLHNLIHSIMPSVFI